MTRIRLRHLGPFDVISGPTATTRRSWFSVSPMLLGEELVGVSAGTATRWLAVQYLPAFRRAYRKVVGAQP